MNSLIFRNCGLLSDRFSSSETIAESFDADDLVLLPVAQGFRDIWDDRQEASLGTEEDYSVLVSGIGTYLGNRGQTFVQCLLNAAVFIKRPNKGNSSISVNVIESKEFGESFHF